MPSEAQSQEPRDSGPTPPVTRAKAAATSPALERRCRGRPRKDGRSVPSTPPPPSKSRKKGRSRGQAQVEDEENMDTKEKKTPQKTEVKEKTTGQRRSTSRRKFNTNPKPDPEPSQEPDPDPPHPDPTVPESSPESAPSANEEDRTSPAAPLSTSIPGPAYIPGEEPPVDRPRLAPDPLEEHRTRPAPDPLEEDRPRPAPDPDPLEEDRPRPAPDPDPDPDPLEGDVGGASPPVSPPLVDEDSLSPLFQLSEDSGGSPTLSLGHTKKRLKQCAFCYRGEDPPLGQGPLVVFGPTPGYIPLHILNRRTSSDRDNDCHDHCYRGDQAPPT
ncbi:protein TsetseEP-like isoform X2 [Anarrhichthys ocellatus]|nr:protein TsetseEP-like isoform X2 [Anarrhichthys ocellatus]